MTYNVPKVAIGLPLLIIPIILIVGLFIFAVIKWGKDKPAVIALCVGGFVSAIFGCMSFFGLMPLAVPALIIAVVLIVGLLVAAVIKSGKGKGVLVALGAVGLIAAVLLGAKLFSRASVETRVMQATVRSQIAQVTAEPAIWHEGVEKEFLANVYPSRRAAVLALARHATETIIDSSLADVEISREIGLLQGDHDRGLLTELARQIERHSTHESVTCRVLQIAGSERDVIGGSEWFVDGKGGEWFVGGSERDAGSDNSVAQLKLWVRLGFDDVQTKRMSWNDEVSSGKVWLQVQGPDGVSSGQVGFAEKPWVESFPDFLSSNPSMQFRLARSGDTCMSQHEAHRQAVEDAMMKISQMLRSVQNNPSIVPANMAITENDLSSGGFIADTFLQRFSGLAGPIYREAILIDTSESKLSQLAERKTALSRAKRITWAKTGGTLAGMFALICVVYLFLNAATRGYYAWSLRIVLIIVLGIGVLVILNFA